MAIANTSPATIGFPMAQKVSFTTTNLSNGDPFVEPHTVSGPTGTFTIPLTTIPISGNKIVIPLTNSTTPGSNFLKLHLPQPGSSDFYVTFCVKTNGVADGYYDYKTGIPSGYRADLRNWIKDGSLLPIGAAITKTKTLNFTVYGLDTNVVSAAIQYSVKFTAIFGGAVSGTGTGTGVVSGLGGGGLLAAPSGLATS